MKTLRGAATAPVAQAGPNRRFALVMVLLVAAMTYHIADTTAVAAETVVQSSVLLRPPHGTTRTIDFVTNVGTSMSVDVSPDGKWIVFDLLGQIYRLPITGGTAECLTQNSGPALNYHPRYSPTGTEIVFISDRGGQDNVWIMRADGADPRPVHPDLHTRYREPVWTWDGKSIIVRRDFQLMHDLNPEIWRFSVRTGMGERLLNGFGAYYRSPFMSHDDRVLYFDRAFRSCCFEKLGFFEEYSRLEALDLDTGKRSFVRSHVGEQVTPEGNPGPGKGFGTAEMAPVPSPNGRLLAFALQLPGTTLTYRGHEFGPRTALFVRDLVTGEDRKVMDPIDIDLSRILTSYATRDVPGYSWTPDGRSIVITQGGRIRRVVVDTGAITTIPFRARVHRVLSEQTRTHSRIANDSFKVKFIQWPASSPDGANLAFVAAGRLWLMTHGGNIRPLAADVAGEAFQYTPAWSPDGKWIAFTTWDDAAGGHLWRASLDGRTVQQLTRSPGQYLYPVWSPDGQSIYFSSGHRSIHSVVGLTVIPPRTEPEPPWSLMRVKSSGGDPEVIRQIVPEGRATIGPRGQVFVTITPGDGRSSEQPPPAGHSAGVGKQIYAVIALRADGSEGEEKVLVPPLPDQPGGYILNQRIPQVIFSPDGKWLAYESLQSVFVVPTADIKRTNSNPATIELDPSKPQPGRIEVSSVGGVYPTWRHDGDLEFASGSRYLRYSPRARTLTTEEIELRLLRNVPHGRIALEGAKIITLRDGRVIDAGTIIVDRNRISCVGQCDVRATDHVVNVAGKTIIPGFVDMHAHDTNQGVDMIPRHNSALALDLAYGTTTIIDPAASSKSTFPISELIAAGRLVGPGTYGFGEGLDCTNAWIRALATIDDARRIVNHRIDWGAAGVKLFRVNQRRKVQLLAEAAWERNVTITIEGGTLEGDVGHAIDGFPGWEHFLANIPIYGDVAKFFGGAHMQYDATMIIAGHPEGFMHYFRPRHDYVGDAKYNRFAPASVVQYFITTSPKKTPKSEFSFPLIAEQVADIVRAGGFSGLGAHGNQPGLGQQWDIWALAEAMSPTEALTIASQGARYIGLDHDIGSIEVGKFADLVVLNADPLADIHNTMDILYVMKDGVLYNADTLDELWPGQHPYGPVPWRH